jgi:hypothetical protein
VILEQRCRTAEEAIHADHPHRDMFMFLCDGPGPEGHRCLSYVAVIPDDEVEAAMLCAFPEDTWPYVMWLGWALTSHGRWLCPRCYMRVNPEAYVEFLRRKVHS